MPKEDKEDTIKQFFKSYAESEEQLDFRIGSDKLGLDVDVISTGSLTLDDALSCGGLPCGRIIQYYGPPGSSKTLMSMIAIKNAQEKDPDARQVFIDAEQTFSTIWATQLGIDTSKVIIIDGDLAVNGRRCFEMLLGVPKEDIHSHKLKGKSKEGLLDQIITKKININLVVLDSLGAIIPPGEDTSAVGKMNISLMARFLATTMKKLSLEVAKANIPFIVINHKRDSMDMYKDHTFMGGNAYSHFLSANIYFELAGAKDALILDENEEKIGQVVRATVEKSKFGPHPKKCLFKVKFIEGVTERVEEVIELGIKYEIIRKPNNVMYEYGEEKFRGKEALKQGLVSKPEMCREIELKVLELFKK